MKNLIILFLFYTGFFQNSFAQAGMWTRLKGDTLPFTTAVYGTLGVSSPSNTPPGLYEPEQWIDQQNNIWIFGGVPGYPDMWKFTMQTLEWTWVAGPGGLLSTPSYGTKGVSSPLNTPGASGIYSAANWTDHAGNLWLMQPGNSVLWKFDTQTLEWTWMTGDTTALLAPVYGVQGVPSPLNTPGTRGELGNCWVDSAGNFWVFGGWQFANYYSDMWRFDVSTNEWTWIKGPDTANVGGVYGTKGIPDPSNNPGARGPHTKWTDSNGNFWIFGGGFSANYYNDTWRFNISTYDWTWMHGWPYVNGGSHTSGLCVSDATNLPKPRWEHKSCWNDSQDNFWMYSGACYGGSGSDLWYYNPLTNIWTQIFGNVNSGAAWFGTLGIPDPANNPGNRVGAVSWMDTTGNLWMFGGGYRNDIWRFTVDTTCVPLNKKIPLASFSGINIVCPGTCIGFTNLSSNATSYQWSFPGALPVSSTDVNPNNICYTNPGSYDVILIAYNANGSDTLTLQNYITVFPQPPVQSIIQSGDTLFALAGSASYQWYYNGNIISGATEYFYVATQSGDYNMIATDANGCEVEAVINNVAAGLSPALSEGERVTAFPNPVTSTINIRGLENNIVDEVKIFNVFGEIVFSAVDCKLLPIDIGTNCQLFTSGLYYLEIHSDKKIHRTKFIKQ
jgi:hypothetical protein